MKHREALDIVPKSMLKIEPTEKMNKNNNNDKSEVGNLTSSSSTLRGNHICGSILIGSYNHLTQLEVCENTMEILDFSALEQLETLKCHQNKLRELILNGKNLKSIIATHNSMQTISIVTPSDTLTYIDISNNHFIALPHWLGTCSQLHTILAHHNLIQTVADFFVAYNIEQLVELDLSYNNLRILNRLPKKFGTNIHQLKLQNNELQKWPENFFAITAKSLKYLNATCNKLNSLAGFRPDGALQLEEIYLSGNYLNEDIFNMLVHTSQLKILHLSYNKISQLPEACIRKWSNLEVLVLSGNLLQKLPDNISNLLNLRELRVHSNNLLQFTPTLSKLSNLRVLDLAHNHLDHVNLLNIMSKNLKYLDLSCNLQLQVDEQQVKTCQRQKNWSLVDVSGKNRRCLPTNLKEYKEDKHSVSKITPWTIGFSETPGNQRKLTVKQLRICNTQSNSSEALLGLFETPTELDNGPSAEALIKQAPNLLMPDTGPDCLKNFFEDYIQLISDSKKTGFAGQSVTLCHIGKEGVRTRNFVKPEKTKKYVLRLASWGKSLAFIIRKTANLCLTNVDESTSTDLTELTLSNEDEFLVICNGHIWEVMDIDVVAREVRKEDNAIINAKRIQDIAQSFGAVENLSVIVVKFKNIGTDVEHLIRELKQTARRKSPTVLMQNSCRGSWGCDSNNLCRYRLPERQFHSPRQKLSMTRSDPRSSPSGQSDNQTLSPVNDYFAGQEYPLARDPLLEEEGSRFDESDSVLSEEQFKCWEYILEQNTQLLFDKELNTISKALTKNANTAKRTNLLKSNESKFISNSSPQLLYNDNVKKPLIPTIMSKHFGSSRSFKTEYNRLDNPIESSNLLSFNGGRQNQKLGGGPNAAYFGSLQRLMPYNLEYNFALTNERSTEDDWSDEDNRMRKYWGVATTEL